MIRRAAWHLVTGRKEPGWAARVATLREVAAMSPAAFRARTDDALAAHLRWAATTVPALKGTVAPDAPLAAFPVLTRARLQEDLEALRDPTRPREAFVLEASGGSTGAPVRVWRDVETSRWTFAQEVHLLEGWGLAPWCRRAYLWGDDREQRDVPWKERVVRRLLPNLFLNAFGMDEARMAGFADRLDAFRPEMVQGYATALDLFASFLLATGRQVAAPAVVRSSAEALSAEARARIERAFRAPVRDVYGSRESTHLAAQCAHGGYHVLGAGRVVEIVDDAGAPAAPGLPGRVLVTDLTNRAMALVRYENGDVASWAPEGAPCPCGAPFPRIERVHGRTSDFLTTPGGRRIHGEWFTHLFYGREGVAKFQVHQRSRTRVEVRTVGPATEEALAPVLAAIRGAMGPEVVVAWERVDAIPLTKAGKHRFTLSDVPFLPDAP
ncbi:MAG: phenylacetate--CoA ligase family protein [Planctomycetota bacterium]